MSTTNSPPSRSDQAQVAPPEQREPLEPLESLEQRRYHALLPSIGSFDDLYTSVSATAMASTTEGGGHGHGATSATPATTSPLFHFATLGEALAFGREVVARLGFRFRVKTTSRKPNQTVHVYVCCQRQGFPLRRQMQQPSEQPSEPQPQQQSEQPQQQQPPPQPLLKKNQQPRRARKSLRCGCKWYVTWATTHKDG